MYAQEAEQLARQGDNTDAATASYVKCRDAALNCGDMMAAGAAAHHLGLIAQQQGDWQQALEHQRYVVCVGCMGHTELHVRACFAGLLFALAMSSWTPKPSFKCVAAPNPPF